MADPHIKSPMDFWDVLTVILYRTGFVLATIGLSSLFLAQFWQWGYLTILGATALCASSLHIYMKKFRYLLQFATWSALIFALLGLHWLALGAAFFTLGGLCFKEYFCFRIPLLNIQPFFLIALWLSLLSGKQYMVMLFGIIVTLLMLIISLRKWMMPLHFDIGDKNKYEV